MTNINCTSKCAWQKDGKCHLDNATSVSKGSDKSCIHFFEKNHEASDTKVN